ncbi:MULTISPECIES: sulfurtransferase TusA family protein [unclassified Wenzhouxiangella]|uniref:sulfurtransferase TusA family protein n=1 Tax=unclassified Wenzhouxiangella TaxID=2613841 RepID=UPI000E32A699|nr:MULTISPECIES: sulfurtransferase TusA family protein [unclassified Wenzhouxiangella]RFF27295.1 sulfurtransferase TusA family protein [Wenzhouxiangella sp. 15181]RFP68728.1 sulfurtransferase TusA family protein [Wenzhouxiangella sp. 15190]
MSERDSNVRVVDCRGMACPEPVWQTRRALEDLPPGAELEVLATDPMAELDLAVFCQRTGHELVRADTRDGLLRARIRVSPAQRPGAG